MKVDRETVVDLWDLPYEGNPDEDVEIVEDEITGNGRWSIRHKLIVRIKDKYYQTDYSVGATESQEERPWELSKEVEFTEVHQVEKVVKVWERV